MSFIFTPPVVWTEKFERDDREPFFVVELGQANKIISEVFNPVGVSLAFFGFNPLFWLHSLSLLFLQSMINCIFALVIYYGIIDPQRKRKRQEQPQSFWFGAGGYSISCYPYVLGYGVVIPILVLLPFWLIDWFDLRNVALILCVGGSNPAMLLFRCLEAMHGTLPPYLNNSDDITNDDDRNKTVKLQSRPSRMIIQPIIQPTIQPIIQHHDGTLKDDQTLQEDSGNWLKPSQSDRTSSSSSLTQFLMYYSSSIQFELDPVKGTPIPFRTTRQLKRKFFQFATLFVQTSLTYSLLLSFDYRLFPPPAPSSPCERQDMINILLDLFHWGNLLNNYMVAALTGLCLECTFFNTKHLMVDFHLIAVYCFILCHRSPCFLATNFAHHVIVSVLRLLWRLLYVTAGACGLGLMISCITGVSTLNFSDAPLTQSSSPSDFWGRRWNRLTGPALRRGVYEPLRKCLHLNTHMAASLTFLASGLLHEYVLLVLSRRRGVPNAPPSFIEGNKNINDSAFFFVPNYGRHLLFFTWCLITLLGERFLGRYLTWCPSKGPLRTFLVLMTTLPLAHLFTDEYVACSFYNDISLGFPKVLLIRDV